MSMFNWQAPPGTNILSSRFWVYWAVTIPLTLLVLTVWLFWLHLHKSDTSDHSRMRSLKRGLDPISPDTISGKGPEWNRLMNFGLRKRGKGAHDSEVATPTFATDDLRRSTPDDHKSKTHIRADTLVQGPRR